jgi:hypothetical protein
MVADARCIDPATIDAVAIVERAVRRLRRENESQAPRLQGGRLGPIVAPKDQDASGVVVQTVAVLRSWELVPCMLMKPHVVGEAHQLCQLRSLGRGAAGAAWCGRAHRTVLRD